MENKKYEDLITLIIKMDSRLSLVEVKGESVEHLLTSRIILKTIKEEFEKLNPVDEEEGKNAV